MTHNFAAYQKYIAAKGWTVTSTKDDPDYKQIIVGIGDNILNIILDYKTNPKTSTVGVYYLSPRGTPPGV